MKLINVFCYSLYFVLSTTAFAQQNVNVKLTIVTKQFSPTNKPESGLLIDVTNFTNQAVAIYTPLGQIFRHIKYYKFDETSQSYVGIVHPYVEELRKEKAFKDSVYRVTGMIVDFHNTDSYNWNSFLYKEFVQNDSLWFDYIVRASKYEKDISDIDINKITQVIGSRVSSNQFTLLKENERFQDFSNINFLYQTAGKYKITLELPDINLGKNLKYLMNNFLLQGSKNIVYNEIFIKVD